MNTTEVVNVVTEVQGLSNAILATIGTVDPAVAGETVLAAGLLNLFAGLATKALQAYSAASGVPITQASVLALLPDMTPLPLPTE